MGPAARRSTRPPRPGVPSEGTSRRRLAEAWCRRRVLCAYAANPREATLRTCRRHANAAPSQAARRLVAAWHHPHCLLEEPVFPSTRPPVVMVALIERRIWTPLDYRRDRHQAGTHSDASRRAAQAMSVPQLSQRWPARRFANVKIQTATGPTRLRNRPAGLFMCVRSYERTYMPARQPQRTN